MVHNQAHGIGAPEPRKACPSSVVLTCGVPYRGDTTGMIDDFNTADYPGLGWAETGPDVVHQITLASTADLRIHVDPDPTILPDLDIILIPDAPGCDTVNWYDAGDHTIIVPDCPPGLYYIIVDGYTKDDVGQYTLTAACAVNLLVVDADGSGSSGPTLCNAVYCTDVWYNAAYSNGFYKLALDGMAPVPTYTYWDKTANGGNLPATATLNNSKSILWFSGRAYGDSDPLTVPEIITAADEPVLAAYLSLGGRVLMIGQDILWDQLGDPGSIDYQGPRLPDGSLLNDYFQVNAVRQDVWTKDNRIYYSTCSTTYNSIPVWGVFGSPIGDSLNCNTAKYLTCLYSSSLPADGAPFNPNVDALVSRFGEPTYNTYKIDIDTNTRLPAAVRYAASLGYMDWFKTEFIALSPECNRNAGDTTTVITNLRGILARTLAWFEEDDSTLRGGGLDVFGFFDDSATGNNNGIPDPGETFTFTLEVDNNDTVAHSVKAYEGFEDWYTDLGAGPWCSDLGSIPAGGFATADFTMTLDASTPTGYRLQPLFNIIQYGTFADTFEAAGGFDNAGWTHNPITGATDWVWSAAQSQTPTQSWFAADVGSISDKVLTSPAFAIEPGTQLAFYHRFAFEGSAPSSCWDGGTLEYAVGPAFSPWTVVPETWFGANGYNGTVSSSYGNPLGGKRAWCGSLSTWTQVTVNLGALAGQNVKLRWHEGDDNSTAATGWYVDSISFPETHSFLSGFGTFVGQADVLLVKDEYWLPNTTGVDIYDSKIKGIAKPVGGNFTTAVWDTAMFAAPTYANPDMGLENDWMRNYDFVVWFTGFDFAYTLLPDPWEQTVGVNPEVELASFLNNRYPEKGEPARLIFSSQDYLYEKYNGVTGSIPVPDFAYAHLKTSYVTQDFIKDSDSMIKGRDGVWPSEKMQTGLQNGPITGGAPFQNYADRILGDLAETGTDYLWSYSLTSAYAAMANLDKNRASRFVFMPFALENVQDGTPDGFPSKKRFLQRTLCQMLMTGASSTPPCGYSAPTCMPDVVLTGRRVNDTDADLTWTAVPGFTNSAPYSEPVYGKYALYGALNNPNPASFALLAATGDTYYLGTESVPAGQCFYYQITGWLDDFDQPGGICP